jgi:hypothetical protein
MAGENMSRKKKPQNPKPEVEKEADYYKLKTKAVKDLIEANEENSPPVSKEELRQYTGRKLKLADWAKLLIIKWWFPGAVCFFFLWGLGGYMADLLDTLFVTGLALGVVTDMLTNNALRFFEKKKGEADYWIMVTKQGYVSFPLNILYAFVVLFCVFVFYTTVNTALASITGNTDKVFIGVEPILFGLIYLGFDLLLIKLKHLISGLIGRKG